MKEQIVIPKNVNENDFLPVAVVSLIWGVQSRRIRGIAVDEEIERRYYSRQGQDDLVAYNALDIYRVTMTRRNEWPKTLEHVIPRGDTYESSKRLQNRVEPLKIQPPAQEESVAKVEAPKAKVIEVEGMGVPQEFTDQMESLSTSISLLAEALTQKRQGARHWRYFQFYVAGVAIIMFAWFMIYATTKV